MGDGCMHAHKVGSRSGACFEVLSYCGGGGGGRAESSRVEFKGRRPTLPLPVRSDNNNLTIAATRSRSSTAAVTHSTLERFE